MPRQNTKTPSYLRRSVNMGDFRTTIVCTFRSYLVWTPASLAKLPQAVIRI